MQNESKAAQAVDVRKVNIHKFGALICDKAGIRGADQRAAVISGVFDVWEAAYSAAIEDAARYMEENYHCSDCNGTPSEFAEEMRRSLKGNPA